MPAVTARRPRPCSNATWPETWVMILSLEAVTEWLSAELGGRDVLNSQTHTHGWLS